MKRLFSAIIAATTALLGFSQTAPKTNVTHPEWSRNAVIYEVNVRQYTPEGTFKAFSKHLPRLKDLGVDILWFMPIHPISELNRKGELGSYYAVRDYKAVNPEFGTMDDFRDVVRQAHDMGMKVIIDWVPNHTGCDNIWTKEHPDWYAKDKNGKMFGPFDWTDTYKLDYSNREMRAAMVDALSFWLRQADIDGFRCDVAGQVPVDFWDETRPQLEKVKSGIFMLAEASEPELEANAFDMAYNWPMKDLFSEIAATSGQYSFVRDGETAPRTFPKKHAVDIDSLLAEQKRTYPADSYMMNMVTNHDLNSWEGTEFERLGNHVHAYAVLTYTLPGMPLIYTGQEIGMNRAFEFFVKDKCPDWGTPGEEPYYNDESIFYSKLNNLKHRRPELAAGNRGGEVTSYPTKDRNVYVFSRTVGKSTTTVGVNLGKEEAAVEFVKDRPMVEGAENYMDSSTVKAIPASLKSGEFFIYIKD